MLAALAGVAVVLCLQAAADRPQALTSDEATTRLPGTRPTATAATAEPRASAAVKLAAALPLLAAPPLAPPSTFHRRTDRWAVFTQPAPSRVRRGGRLAVVLLFGLPLLASASCSDGPWARRGRACPGAAPGPRLQHLPLLPLVYTDAQRHWVHAHAARRGPLLRRPVPARAALLGLAFGLAIAAKFDRPAAAAGGARRPAAGPGYPGGEPRLAAAPAARAGGGRGLGASRTHLPRRQPALRAAYGRETIRSTAPIARPCGWAACCSRDERPLLAIERLDPRAAQWLTGLLATAPRTSWACSASASRTARAAALVSTSGAAAVETLCLLIATRSPFAAVLAGWRRARARPPTRCGSVCCGCSAPPRRSYFAAAAASNYNAGIRTCPGPAAALSAGGAVGPAHGRAPPPLSCWPCGAESFRPGARLVVLDRQLVAASARPDAFRPGARQRLTICRI